MHRAHGPLETTLHGWLLYPSRAIGFALKREVVWGILVFPPGLAPERLLEGPGPRLR